MKTQITGIEVIGSIDATNKEHSNLHFERIRLRLPGGIGVNSYRYFEVYKSMLPTSVRIGHRLTLTLKLP